MPKPAFPFLSFFFLEAGPYGSAENEDSWESNRPQAQSANKKRQRHSSVDDRYESHSDDSESKSRPRKSPLRGTDSVTDQSHHSEPEDECNRQFNKDNNSYFSDSYRKSRRDCSLSLVKTEDCRNVVNRQDNKPILKFSVNAILGTDHGKNNFKPGKFRICNEHFFDPELRIKFHVQYVQLS